MEKTFHKYSFENLEVWQMAKDFVKDIYLLTNTFPNFEKYSLTSQMNRAAISIASNIAEGSTRTNYKDQARFSQIAYGSLMEILCQIIIARELNYINDEDYYKLRKKIETISFKINSLRKYQLKKITTKQ